MTVARDLALAAALFYGVQVLGKVATVWWYETRYLPSIAGDES